MDPRADRGGTVLVGVSLPPRYEPIRRIARGGMATVWCAHDRTLDRRVAIKLLAERYAGEELAGRRFKREARAAARLSGHPNVVTIYDVGEATSDDGSTGRPFLVMEYLSGGTVADALRTGHLDRPTALRWVRQAAEALDYAHGRGVIHRDVKLANFLLDRERVLHVADFGIAQLGTEDTLTVTGEVVGTAAYLAPERALGHPATEASDRYGLAVAAFELLVGQRPFTAEHFAVQARQHVENPPPAASRRNPELPPALDAVLARGMAKRPEQRFATALALTDAIEQALTPGTAGSRRPARTAATRPIATPTPARPAAAVPSARQDRPAASGYAGTTVGPRSPGASTRRGARPRIAALAALAAVLVGVGIAAAVSGGPGNSGSAGGRASLAGAAASHRSAQRHAATNSAQPPATTTTTNSTGTTSTSPSPAPTGGADTLEAQGHALMMAGNYQSAIPVLRHAVASASPTSLTYAYALYDLGRSLRLSGDPRAAVAILWQRMQIPNQIPVVRTELTLALQALGEQAAKPGPGHGGDHHHAGGQDGSGSGPGGGPGAGVGPAANTQNASGAQGD